MNMSGWGDVPHPPLHTLHALSDLLTHACEQSGGRDGGGVSLAQKTAEVDDELAQWKQQNARGDVPRHRRAQPAAYGTHRSRCSAGHEREEDKCRSEWCDARQERLVCVVNLNWVQQMMDTVHRTVRF